MKADKKISVEFRAVKYWRDPRILDADISELPAVADQTGAPEISVCQEIELSLLEHNQSPVRELVLALEQVFRRHALREVADMLREKLEAGDTPEASAVRTVLLGKPESARAEAERLGVSHTAILKARRKAKAGFQKVSSRRR
jgi:hypothetical protein